jgi:hypothetical protein
MQHERRRGQVHTGLWWENLRERENLEDLDADGRIILKWISKNWHGGTDWIDRANYNDRWPALVNVN